MHKFKQIDRSLVWQKICDGVKVYAALFDSMQLIVLNRWPAEDVAQFINDKDLYIIFCVKE